MKAKDILQTGDIVELRNGHKFIVFRNIENIDDFAVNPCSEEYIDIEDRDDYLKSNYGYSDYDVVKIYRPIYQHSLKIFNSFLKSFRGEYFKLVWEESEIQIGDKVKVIDNGQGYTTYTRFLQNYPELLGRYAYGEPVPMHWNYEVVHMGNHLKYHDRKLYCIQNSLGQIFIIEEKGVKKI